MHEPGEDAVLRAQKRLWHASAAAGLVALRQAVLHAAGLVECSVPDGPAGYGVLLAQAPPVRPGGGSGRNRGEPAGDDDPEKARLVALVELARAGDADAFGQLYDHYVGIVYRFLYYRVDSDALAQDLTSETFFRALRSISRFSWQGRDFGAWLITISRNLVNDHFKSSRQRVETTTADLSAHDSAVAGPEDEVLAQMTNQALLAALGQLASEQRDCLVLRFLQGLSIAETAAALRRSEGAVKQLQLRGIRNLARLLPEEVR